MRANVIDFTKNNVRSVNAKKELIPSKWLSMLLIVTQDDVNAAVLFARYLQVCGCVAVCVALAVCGCGCVRLWLCAALDLCGCACVCVMCLCLCLCLCAYLMYTLHCSIYVI